MIVIIVMKTILITGGGGFIGKNLIKELYNKNNTIISVDNYKSSNDKSFYNFLILNSFINVIHYNIDITDTKILNNVLQDYKINEIYHLASIASPIIYKKYELETLDVAYLGTRNILELAKKNNSRVLFSSTSEIYGDPKINPQHEEYYGNVNTFGERSCYDCGKRVAEALCYAYQKKGIDIRIARLFNTYGVEMDINDGRIMTETIKHIISDTILTINGDGTQTRSICYISDTIEMLITLMASDYKKPINIGNNIELSINEIVKIIEEVSKKTVKKRYIDLTQNDPLIRKPCLKLNNLILKKEIFVDIKTGVKRMFDFYMEKKNE
jgi:nucleoside-diphosphate-sugar epimerase